MIPKVIHYCWFGRNPIPAYLKKIMESWKRMCPDYEIKRWDESNFDVSSHPFIKAAYEAKAWAFVSDYARLKIIYENGGIYLDTDVELLKNLDFLLNYQCYIGVQQSEHLCATGLGFGAAKHSPVVQKMLMQYDGLEFSIDRKIDLACPRLNNRVLVDLGYRYSEEIEVIGDVAILPSRLVDPVAPGDSKDLLCFESVSIHHYSASWGNKSLVIKRKIFMWVGQRRINKIKKALLFWRQHK